jgi:hypothetical protein
MIDSQIKDLRKQLAQERKLREAETGKVESRNSIDVSGRSSMEVTLARSLSHPSRTPEKI